MASPDVTPNPVGPPPAAAKKGRAKPFNFHDYIVATLVALVLCVVYGGYYLNQRTYFYNPPPGIDPFNVPDKVLAIVGMVLFAFCFLIGPIYRYFNKFDYLMQYRKEIGIVGGFFVIIHPVIAYFFLPLTFPQSEISFLSLTYSTALAGSLVAVFLIFISFQNAVTLLGANRWWFLHRYGLRVLVLFSVIHFFCIEWNTWTEWLFKSPEKPSAAYPYTWIPEPTVFAGLFTVWVIVVRLYETIFLYKDLGIKPKDIAPNAELKRRGRKFVIYSLAVLIACNIYVIGRWMYYYSVR
jgi:DMSO/TMAO reductase YedYZ heme-binding membrane subunit